MDRSTWTMIYVLWVTMATVGFLLGLLGVAVWVAAVVVVIMLVIFVWALIRNGAA